MGLPEATPGKHGKGRRSDGFHRAASAESLSAGQGESLNRPAGATKSSKREGKVGWFTQSFSVTACKEGEGRLAVLPRATAGKLTKAAVSCTCILGYRKAGTGRGNNQRKRGE